MNYKIWFWYVVCLMFSAMAISRPLKILFVVGHFPEPSQTFIVTQMIGLIDRGHDVSIFSLYKDSFRHMLPDVEKYKLLDRVIYGTLPKNMPDCDIVFCQFGYHGRKIFQMPEIKQWLKNKKVVTCLRGTDITVRILNNIKGYTQLFRKGDLFLPVCDYFKKLLIKSGCPSNKIVVHHSAINTERFSFKERSLPAKNETLNLISVCRLVEKKGLIYAIKAVARIARRYPNIQYNIVGDGPERSSLEKLIKSLGMSNKIILHGWKGQQDVIAMLDQSHIFMLPSVTAADGNEEGIPNALKEAMAMGLPVIGTWHSGTPELIEDGVSGFLVPQKDFMALHNKILYIIRNPQILKSVGLAARQCVEEKFEVKQLIKDLEGLFYRLINRSADCDESALSV
jgi:colanic acid/amylovoran biosynthesis glycosyltransferase